MRPAPAGENRRVLTAEPNWKPVILDVTLAAYVQISIDNRDACVLLNVILATG